MPAGFELREKSQSMYGLVEVIDDTSRKVRFLRVDHSVIGGDLIPEYDTVFGFVYRLELVRFLRAQATSMLQLGLGTGSLIRSLEKTSLKTDVVELDPTVVSLARKYFKFKSTGEVFEEDVRTFLNRTKRQYDIIVHDTFTGGSTPEHLLSKEVFERIHSMLSPGGLLTVNFVGGVTGPDSEATVLVGQTLRSEFRHVRAFTDAGDYPIKNVTFFASDEDLQLEVIEKLRFQHRDREEARRGFFTNELQIPRAGNTTQLITDEYNPLSRLQLPIAEAHAAAMNKLLPPEIWLD
jgi:hypothetical protein